jgi:5'(3')-deoxyribonucleotidase
MAQIEHIFCDLDGIFADYLTPSLQLWGFDPEAYPANCWNVWEALGIAKSDYIGDIDRQPDFWRQIKPYDWCDALAGFFDDIGIRWSIVTSPWLFRHPTLHSDKVAWVRKYIGSHIKCHIIDDKELLAKPGRLLIDDSDLNVSKFVESGGRAVLFPRRWNAMHEHEDTGFEHVLAEVQRIVEAD